MSIIEIRSEESECRGPNVIQVEERNNQVFLKMGGSGPMGNTFWWSMRLSIEQARSLAGALDHNQPPEPAVK
jgi:hypothetical protein